MMTEEEAKTKWCPFARARTAPTQSVANRFEDGGETRCIGSACMVWRTGMETDNRQADSGPPAGEGWEKFGPVIGEGGFVTKRQSWRRIVGYCGPAGRPA